MLDPRKTFLHSDGILPSQALCVIARKLGLLRSRTTFAELAQDINVAGWSGALDALHRDLRAYYQSLLPELRPHLEQLGILAASPGPDEVIDVDDGLWPSAAAALCIQRLQVGINAWNAGKFRAKRVFALASSKPRNPFPGELEHLKSIDIGDPALLCTDEKGLYEDWMMRRIWEALGVAGKMQK